MKKLSIFTICALGLASAALTSCKKQGDEITSYTLNRNLSPVGMQASNIGETSATIKWTESVLASSYNMLVCADDSMSYDLTSPVKTISGITPDQIPYTIDGLLFDTQYTVYLQAITEGEDSRTSTWNGVYFRTNTKQFLKNPTPADIADRSVILTWEVEDGFDVSTIVVGSITHQITAEEKAAGKATIEGLTPETEYTAYLYYNGKQCGNRKFTTIADLQGATLVHEGDDLASIIANAEANAVIAVFPGTFVMNENESGQAGAAKVNNSITIKGVYPTAQPVIKGRFELYGGAALTITQVVIDGKDNASGDQTFNYKDNTDYGALLVENTEIKNFVKGITYGNVTGTIEAITFSKCLIHDIECDGGDFFDIRKNYVKAVKFEKSTMYNIAHKRDFIRYDDASGSYSDAAPVITVDQCTIDNVLNESSGKRLLYVRFVGNVINWTNNIVSNTKAVYTNQSKTSTPTYTNNYYFGCSNASIFAASDAETKVYWNGDVNAKNGADPMYKDAANGDFTLGNEDVVKLNVGDPRWYTAQ